MNRPPALPDTPFPDCKTAHEALALLSGAILAVPDDAGSIGWSFGRRAVKVGDVDHGWYWGVTWTMAAGSVDQRPRAADKKQALAKATEEALNYIAEQTAIERGE